MKPFEKICLILKDEGRNIVDLSKLTGISETTLRSYQKKTIPTLENWIKILKALNLKHEDIVEDDFEVLKQTFEDSKKIGDKLQSELKLQKISIAELSKKTGISKTLIKHLISGEVKCISFKVICLIADALEISIDYFDIYWSDRNAKDKS